MHVHGLRKALGANRILTRSPGYLVRVERGELDVERFEQLSAAGGDGLHEALALWRGPALADLAYEPFAQAAAARLDESRLAALEARIELDLAQGRHAGLVGELEALVASHPHRERLQAHRIVALYGAGRQADALAATATPATRSTSSASSRRRSFEPSSGASSSTTRRSRPHLRVGVRPSSRDRTRTSSWGEPSRSRPSAPCWVAATRDSSR